MARRTKRQWSFAEDRRLLQLAASLKSVETVAAEMKRSPATVAQMAKRLGVSLKSAEGEMSPSKPARRHWTADELKKLDGLIKAGKTAPEIATALQRTSTSIYAKLQRFEEKRLLAEPMVDEIGFVDQAQFEVKMKPGPRPKRSKGTWYVSFEPKERLPGQRAFLRQTETFRNEQDAKAFAKAKLTDGSNINAGTLNPYRPKRIITSAQISGWLKEPDDK